MSIRYPRLRRADGSGIYSGKTVKAVASISGPILPPTSVTSQLLALSVHIRPLSGIAGTKETVLAATVRTLFERCILREMLPRTVVQMVVQMLSPSGKLWTGEEQAVMINAAMLALLDAGSIPLRGVICAVNDPALEDDCYAYLFSSKAAAESDSSSDNERAEGDHDLKIPYCQLIYASSRGETVHTAPNSGMEQLARHVWMSIWKAEAGHDGSDDPEDDGTVINQLIMTPSS